MKVKNVSGVPLCFDGVQGTVRFLVGETKFFSPDEITQSIQEGIDARSLVVLPSSEVNKVTRKSTKKNKEVIE